MPNPQLSGLVSAVGFQENTVNATPQLIDSDVTLSDAENNFNGGTITVSGLLAEDRVAIRNQGAGAGQIGISGSDVTYGGVTIGSFTGGVGGTFTVTLNASALSVSVDALIQNLTYANVSDTPTASRTLRINVHDAGGLPLGLTELTGSSNPFGSFDTDLDATPSFLDLDGDGDLDMVAGSDAGGTLHGQVRSYYNNGNGTFTERTGGSNPINVGVAPDSNISPGTKIDFATTAAVDWDGDGDQDLVVSDYWGSIEYFRNDDASPTFTELNGVANPFYNVMTAAYAANAAFFLDLDGDGDFDLLRVDAYYGGAILAYRNDIGGNFTQLTGGSNPFGAIGATQGQRPTTVDWDGDGDLDVVIGNGPTLRYIEDTGATYVERTGSSNPFTGLSFSGNSAPAFADVDGDGDRDMLVGQNDGTFRYFRNDANGAPITVDVTAEADNTAPVIDLNGAAAGTGNTVGYTENDAPVALAPAGTVVDAESPNFDTGRLIVTLGVTAALGDVLRILNQGTGAGQIGVSGSAVSYQGVQIGTFAGGALMSPLIVTLDSDATPAAVQALTRAITYSNALDTLTSGSRTAQFFVEDGDGGTSATASATINVTGVNDDPVLTLGQDMVGGLEDYDVPFSAVINRAITVADVDDTTLAVTLTVGQGTLTLSQTTDLVFSIGDGTGDATMTFSGSAAAINAALEGLIYRGNANYFGGDSLDIVVDDGDATSTDSIAITLIDDLILGTPGDDVIYRNGGGDDSVSTLAGNDVIYYGGALTAADDNDGGDGTFDQVVLQGNITVTLTALSLVNVERLVLLSGADGTYGDNSGVNYSFNVTTVDGTVAAGKDLLVNGVTLQPGEGFIFDGSAETDGRFTVYGGAGNDSIIGGAGNDVFLGGLGADLLIGGSGDDWYYVDNTLDGVIEGAAGGTLDRVFASVSYTLGAGAHVERLSTADGAAGTGLINLTGNELVNVIYGNAAANTLDGKAGADLLAGFGGDDVYYVDDALDSVTEGAGGGADQVRAAVSYRLGAGVSVETLTTTDAAGTTALNLTGNEIVNSILGNDGANVLDGRGGADILTGRAGDDWYYVDDAGDMVLEGAGGGTDRVLASANYTLGAGAQVERLSTDDNAGTGAINLTGNGLANLIYGNAGANVLDGKGGADAMAGLAGSDSYYVDNALDSVTEGDGDGLDTVYASVSYKLEAGVHVEMLSTTNSIGTGAIDLTGNELVNAITGNDGANVLDGRGGADTLDGRGGDDWYYVDNVGDLVVEGAGEGEDRVFASASYTLSAGAQVERLTTADTAGTDAIDLTGNALDDLIYGNAGANVLDGKGGNDTLVGFGGGDGFAFTTALGAGNVDTIGGFSVADDTILLDDAVFTGLAAGALAAGAFVIGSAAAEVDDRIVYNSATGALLFDVDGFGGAVAVQFATLAPALALTSADFLAI